MKKLNNKYILFDDSEYNDLIDNKEDMIETDEEFEKQVSNELNNYLKEKPLQYDNKNKYYYFLYIFLKKIILKPLKIIFQKIVKLIPIDWKSEDSMM